MGNGITREDVRFPPGVVIPGCSQYQCRQNIIRRSQCSTLNLCQSCRNIAIEIRPHNGNLLEKYIIPDTQLLLVNRSIERGPDSFQIFIIRWKAAITDCLYTIQSRVHDSDNV